MAHASIGQCILDCIQKNPNDTAIRHKVGESWRDVHWKDLGTEMEVIASGLLTAIDDLPDRAAISILGNTSPEWIACDFAALSVGLRTVPVYATLLPPEVGYLHTDTECVIAICENGDQLAKVREMQGGFTFFKREYPAAAVKIRHIIVIDTNGVTPADDWESLDDLKARGKDKLEETAAERKRRAEDTASRELVCTYTYTSGTTGPPKGVIQTNDNMLGMLEKAQSVGLIQPTMREGGMFLFLPLAHSFGRLIELSAPFFNLPIVISSIPTLGADLGATRPGFFPAAPRVFEKMKARIETAVAGAPPIRQKLFHWAVRVGLETVPYRCEGKPLPGGLKFRLRFADKLVLSKLRARLGFDRAQALLSGSAPLNADVHKFFLAMGVDLLEAYGLTETCPGLTSNLPGKIKVGTVGLPIGDIQIKIADDGEILAKGSNITSGYLNREEATAEAFDADGWFMTGDLGSQDGEGFVKITGRKKELMKTSGGKYIAPNKIEGEIKLLPIIQECVTVADTRNYVTALIAIDPEELAEWSQQTGNAADMKSDQVKAAVQAHVDEVNGDLAKYETIKYFRLVEPMTVEGGLLTASLKVKRKVVYARYADLIDDMYTSGKKPS